MIERRIKELTIALEALSRINGYTASTMYSDLIGIVEDLIKQLKEPSPQPAINSTDDAIPF